MNRNNELEEFLEAERILQASITNTDSTTISDDVILTVHNTKIYWSRQIHLLEYLINIKTLAYGGENSGRKLFEASIPFSEWILNNKNLFKDQQVCELGCGSTALPGIASSICHASKVLLWDMDSDAIEDAKENINANRSLLSSCNLHYNICYHVGLWSECRYNPQFAKAFDIILGCEIVYDAININELYEVIDFILKDSGQFILCVCKHGRGGLHDIISVMQIHKFNFKEIPLVTEKCDELCFLSFFKDIDLLSNGTL